MFTAAIMSWWNVFPQVRRQERQVIGPVKEVVLGDGDEGFLEINVPPDPHPVIQLGNCFW